MEQTKLFQTTPDANNGMAEIEISANLELARLLVLLLISAGLEGRVGGQPYILVLVVADGFLPEGQPGDRAVMADLLPLLALIRVFWNGDPSTCSIGQAA